MFTKTDSQLSLFDVKNVFPDALPKDDWRYSCRDRIYSLIDEEQFRHLYKEESGRPNKSIKTMISLLIFMGMERVTWRGVEFQYPRRLDWLVATRTPLKKQRADSFFIHGWLQILSRYGLFKETLGVFLQDLRKHKPDVYDVISKELSREYLEKDHEAAQRQVRHMAEDRHRIYKVFANRDEVKGYESFKTLVTVFHQQCKVTEGNETLPCEITIREKPEGEEIVSSPPNTDARYVKKGKQKVCGQKGFVSETCNEGNKTQFITDVEVTPATRADAHELPEIQKRLEESGKKPQEQYADAGFVNGQAILSSQADGIKLEGPSAGRSESFEKYEAEDRPLDIADFEVKGEGEIGGTDRCRLPGKANASGSISE